MIRREVEVLLGCARTRMDETQKQRIHHLLQRDLDWQFLLRISNRHALSSLLYWNLRSTFSDLVPPRFLSILHGHFQNNSRHNLARAGELVTLLGLLRSHGVPAIPIKGPALAAAAYGNLALREFSDLDILVRPEHVAQAQGVLVAEGYQPEFEFNRDQEAVLQKFDCEREFVRAGGRSIVDIHWRLSPIHLPPSIDVEHLWSDLDTVELAGVEVPVPQPEDLLLIVAAHGAKHYWERLGWVCDVAELVHSRPDMDWQQVAGRARESGAWRILALGLNLASSLLDAPLPIAVRRSVLTDPAVAAIAQPVRDRFLNGALAQPGFVSYAKFQMQVRNRPFDRIRFVTARLAIPHTEDWRLLGLASPLLPLYYPLHPLLLVGRHLGVLKATTRLSERLQARSRGRDSMRHVSSGLPRISPPATE